MSLAEAAPKSTGRGPQPQFDQAPSPEDTPPRGLQRSIEKPFFDKEGIPQDTLSQIGENLGNTYKKDPLATVKQLTHLKRAGVDLVGESQKKAFQSFRDDISKYENDGPKLANYLKHLKNLGAIDEIDNKYKDVVNKAIQNIVSKDMNNLDQLSQLCIDAKYIGAKTDFEDVREYLAIDLKNQIKKSDNEATIALRMARLKHLGLPFAVGEITPPLDKKKNDEIKPAAQTESMLHNIGLTKDKLGKMRNNGNWQDFTILRIATDYLGVSQELSPATQEAALEGLKDVEVESKRTNNWHTYLSYAGNLSFLSRKKEKKATTFTDKTDQEVTAAATSYIGDYSPPENVSPLTQKELNTEEVNNLSPIQTDPELVEQDIKGDVDTPEQPSQEEEQPVFTEIPSPALSEEEQIAQFPVPKRDEEKNDNWGEQYMKDYVDKPEQPSQEEEQPVFTEMPAETSAEKREIAKLPVPINKEEIHQESNEHPPTFAEMYPQRASFNEKEKEFNKQLPKKAKRPGFLKRIWNLLG